MASRHLARSIALQTLFEWDFKGKPEKDKLLAIAKRNIEMFGGKEMKYPDLTLRIVEGVFDKLEYLDEIISKAAPEWPIDKIAIVDRNVLRIGIFELLYSNPEEVPPKVAINEAIELAKGFGGINSGKFVNGVLGTVYRTFLETQDKAKKENESS